MTLPRQIKLTAGAIAIAFGAAALDHWLTDRRVKSVGTGRVLCPGDVDEKPAPSASLAPGDFVVVQLISSDRRFTESTWATVESVGDTTAVVVLTGEQTSSGLRPLATAKHGFRIGAKLFISKACIWDVFGAADFEGQVLCGPQLAALDSFVDAPIRALGKGLALQPGDRVQIVIASKEANGTAWWELVWASITTLSMTGQIVYAVVDEEPEHTDLHGLAQGSILKFNRDCVVKVT